MTTMTIRLLAIALCIAAVPVPPTAFAAPAARRSRTASSPAAALAEEMRSRGEPEGEVRLALAGLYAKTGALHRAKEELEAARRRGVTEFRVDLALADVHRREGSYDAALRLLRRAAVQRGGTHVTVQLWKTLYEAQLRRATEDLDVTAVRQHLLAEGLYLPASLVIAKDAFQRSEESAAAGYDELLAGNPRAAVGFFQQALDAFPGNARAHRGLGIAWARCHDHRRAAGAYSLYLMLRPHAADAEAVDRALMRYWKRRRPTGQ
jgi:tetratricopeptide (TPR) repeat protein